MEIVRESGKIILKNSDGIVEEYNFKDNIDLKKLVELLLGDNLTHTFTLKDKLDDKTTEEENLVSVIKDLIDDYNSKVTEYGEFIAEEKAV
ncbi:MAG: hypothetical protein PWQ10_494 [Patescibacteria group bacterium]|nr:hypothetical protein [Patescibacteria group bacterium]